MSAGVLALLRTIAAGQARLELQIEEVRDELRALRAEPPPAGADLLAALRGSFGHMSFTASVVIEAAGTDGTLFDAVHPLVDLDGDRPAVHLGRILARLPGLERVGDLRGAGLFRLRR